MITFILIINIILVSLAIRINGKLVLSPISCGAFLWSIYSLASYVVMNNSYTFSLSGILFILSAFWLMLIAERYGFVYANKNYKRSKETKYIHLFSLSNQSWLFLKIICILGFLSFFYQMGQYGFSLTSLTSLSSLASANNQVAVARYSGNGINNIISQFLLTFVYAAPICGGVAFNFSRNNSAKYWSIATIAPGILLVLLTNTKATVIGVFILWLSAFLTSHFFVYKCFPKITLKIMVISLVLAMAFIMFLLFSMTLRNGELSMRTIGFALNKFSIYAFGGVQSFDWWLGNIYQLDPKFGSLTYLSVADIIGIAEKAQGVYTSYIGTSSNVFTVFRGVIEDFGLLLGLFYLISKGFLCGICLRVVCKAKSIKVMPITYLISQYFFFVYGYILSPWTYTVYILSFLILILYLVLAKSKSVVLNR